MPPPEAGLDVGDEGILSDDPDFDEKFILYNDPVVQEEVAAILRKGIARNEARRLREAAEGIAPTPPAFRRCDPCAVVYATDRPHQCPT